MIVSSRAARPKGHTPIERDWAAKERTTHIDRERPGPKTSHTKDRRTLQLRPTNILPGQQNRSFGPLDRPQRPTARQLAAGTPHCAPAREESRNGSCSRCRQTKDSPTPEPREEDKRGPAPAAAKNPALHNDPFQGGGTAAVDSGQESRTGSSSRRHPPTPPLTKDSPTPGCGKKTNAARLQRGQGTLRRGRPLQATGQEVKQPGTANRVTRPGCNHTTPTGATGDTTRVEHQAATGDSPLGDTTRVEHKAATRDSPVGVTRPCELAWQQGAMENSGAIVELDIEEIIKAAREAATTRSKDWNLKQIKGLGADEGKTQEECNINGASGAALESKELQTEAKKRQ
ncbi:hypothetical protein NDU88_002906 [Pleurodeles waltl]|uniref:Uncharacterized protein n=1 Tax=Pleurodeles waltl TaxID=8319 RepID=A0AAV7T3N9_PLEWA|nr:hypothetical protein NDU88_002906 [Pleurodeles waltl]